MRIPKFTYTLFLIIGCYISIQSQETEHVSSVFYSNIAIFVGKDAVLSVNAGRVVLQEELSGEGVLRIGNTPETHLVINKPLTVSIVEVEHTLLSMQSEWRVNEQLVVTNAMVLLNNFDLHAGILNLNTGYVVENGIGICSSLPHIDRGNTRVCLVNSQHAPITMHIPSVFTLFETAYAKDTNMYYETLRDLVNANQFEQPPQNYNNIG